MGHTVWFGDDTGKIPDAEFNSLTSFTTTLSLTIPSGDCVGQGNTGILFRAKNVTSVTEGGQQYLCHIKPAQDTVNLLKMNNGVQSLGSQDALAIEYDTEYNLTVIGNDINKYFIYLNNTLLTELSNIELNDYEYGSFGLRTSNCPTIFHSLIVDNYTNETLTATSPSITPTAVPSMAPSNISTHPSIAPSSSADTTSTSVEYGEPSNSPTDEPTRRQPHDHNISTNIPTNIQGGALGVWAGFSPWSDTLICQP